MEEAVSAEKPASEAEEMSPIKTGAELEAFVGSVIAYYHEGVWEDPSHLYKIDNIKYGLNFAFVSRGPIKHIFDLIKTNTKLDQRHIFRQINGRAQPIMNARKATSAEATKIIAALKEGSAKFKDDEKEAQQALQKLIRTQENSSTKKKDEYKSQI